jgi:hypothetical protein
MREVILGVEYNEYALFRTFLSILLKYIELVHRLLKKNIEEATFPYFYHSLNSSLRSANQHIILAPKNISFSPGESLDDNFSLGRI